MRTAFPTQPFPAQTPSDNPDPKPRFAVGHMSLEAADVQLLNRFYVNVGLRSVVDMGRAAIVELSGGTHIIIQQSGRSGSATLDFIVQDIDDTHEVLAAHGANPTPIRRGSPHDSFTATDPEGNRLIVHSTHAIGPV